MTNLTMGQRIAAQRKLAGLSQEALSEQLEVSRQAVSKWESDGAIPEIDKLIALGRIFGVSVGWLLGTETECRYDPDAGLNETQTKMVEEIAARYQPARTPLWKRALAAVCALALLCGVGLHYQSRIDDLAADNVTTQTQLAQLTQANQELQAQLDSVSAMLEKQESAEKLLSGYGISGFASDDLQNVTLVFALQPKVYQQSVTAELRITNPDGYKSELECRYDGAQYLLRVTLPLADGYQFRFVLMGHDTYQEELLNHRDPALGSLKTLSGFYLDPADSRAESLKNGDPQPWAVTDTAYTFRGTLYPPSTVPDSGYNYEDIRFTLYLGGEAIWQESWKEEFLEAFGADRSRALPIPVEVSASLPELSEGDELKLELSATYYTGATITTVLDHRIAAAGEA